MVRELIYDFRDWQTIEATGKGGDDDGFDIRAYERVTTTTVDDEGKEVIRPMDGNLWMIQCKREKRVPPSKIKQILADIDPDNPPYGYILAAATNFSKKTYDTFRDQLTELGVLEFYLWGNSTLETELHQPKNDRILFTFFGISNVRLRRSRSTEIRTEVTNKNRVMRLLDDNSRHSWILVRDSKDRHYPYKSEYADFDERPRWKSYEVTELHPRGVIILLKRCYAFVDEIGKTFDLADPPHPLQNPYDHHRQETQSEREIREKLGLARDYWERLPLKNQAMFTLDGIIRYEDMLVIDDKGDKWNDLPHIYVDFKDGSPVSGTLALLEKDERQIELDEFKREAVFPKSFSEPKFGTVYDDETLPLPGTISEQYVNFRGGDLKTLYDVDGRLDHLEVDDVGVVRFGNKDERFLQVTHRYKLAGEDVLRDQPQLAWQVSLQIGREPTSDDMIEVLEVRECYKHQWKER